MSIPHMDIDRMVHFGRRMALEGRVPLALEVLGMGVQCDIKQGINVFDKLDNVETVSRHYEEMAESTRDWARLEPHPPMPAEGEKIRVAYVQSNLLDDTNPQSQRLKGVLKYHNRDRFESAVFSTEELAERPYPLFGISQALANSRLRAPKLVEWLISREIGLYVDANTGTMLDNAYRTAHAIQGFKPHIVVYQGTPACPVLCLLAAWKLAPVQVNINTGVPMHIDGLDATIYFNEKRRAGDESKCKSDKGLRRTFYTGIDIQEPVGPVPDGTPQKRTPDQVILITASNHVGARFTPEFMGVMVGALKKHPNALYFIVGGTPLDKQMKFFAEAGVASQVAFLGIATQVREVLQVGDIYVNEFPIGGAQAVIEAMSLGIPVVATHYSDKHQHSCGAGYVGPFAIKPHDIREYADYLDSLIGDEMFRRKRSAETLARVNEHFAYHNNIKQYEDLYEELITG